MMRVHVPKSGNEKLSSAVHACGSLRSEEHTSELQSHHDLVCRLLLEKKKFKRKGSQKRRRHKAKQTGKRSSTGIKSNNRTNRHNLIRGVHISIHLTAMNNNTIPSRNR